MQREAQPVFDTWIYRCPNLEYLDIAMCRAPEFGLERFDLQQFWNFEIRDSLEKPPPKLTEIRLLTDKSFYVDGSMLLMGLAEFPALKRLALGHLMMRNNTWPDFFESLRNVDKWKVELDVLWLLNTMTNTILPMNRGTWSGPSYVRYEDDNVARKATKGAAKEVRIMHLPFPWGEGNVVAGIGSGHDFPRFEAFENDEP